MRDEGEPAGEGRSPFGQLLREFRIAARLSQEALAERAGLSTGGISVLERGARLAPHRDTVSLLAQALELPAADRARLQAATARPSVPRRREIRAADDGQIGVHNLPLSLSSFYGREEETAALSVSVSERRLVTLVGIGGVGKTRLALETVHALIERYSDGVWYVELAPLSDPGLVAPRIASTLGMAVRYSGTEPSSAWIAQLVNKHLLIVLDNCEHVLDAAAAATELILERCPGVHVLATSREALRIRGEYVVRVDPLSVPAASAGRPPELSDLRASPAEAGRRRRGVADARRHLRAPRRAAVRHRACGSANECADAGTVAAGARQAFPPVDDRRSHGAAAAPNVAGVNRLELRFALRA
jgi:transcriptional regulator with XRE-family HTH domain